MVRVYRPSPATVASEKLVDLYSFSIDMSFLRWTYRDVSPGYATSLYWRYIWMVTILLNEIKYGSLFG